MKKYTLKQRIAYWFENRISDSPMSLVRIMSIVTIVLAAIVALIITYIGLVDKSDYFYTFWDTLASSINAWMPYSEDVDFNTKHIILTSIAAIFGLFFTSFLIGVISNSLEEKIEEIKKGNTKVLEEDHVVILGFIPGDYTLLNELINSSNGKRITIVIAGENDKLTAESLIRDNVATTPNVKIVFRTVDFTNYNTLNCCSIENCKTVIINPIDDEKVIKIIYAVRNILDKSNRKDVYIVATIRNKEYTLPSDYTKENKIILLLLTDFVAKIIARACTQPGLSLVYSELFSNEGSEFYSIPNSKYIGMTFEKILLNMDGGVPVGIINEKEVIINPKKDYIIQNDDDIVVFANDNKSSHLLDNEYIPTNNNNHIVYKENKQNILILGYNTSSDVIFDELPVNNCKIKIAGVFGDKKNLLINKIKNKDNIKLCDDKYSIDSISDLEEISKDADRIVILNNYDKDGYSADIKVMLRLTRLREIRNKLNLKFTLSAELRRAANVSLVYEDDNTDYIVRSNLFSMFLSRLVIEPKLEPVYKELLTKGNNELMLLPIESLEIDGDCTTQEIRSIVYNDGFIAIGYIKYSNNGYIQTFNPSLDSIIHLSKNDSIVVIGTPHQRKRRIPWPLKNY